MSDVVARAKAALEGITEGPWTWDGKRAIDGAAYAEVLYPGRVDCMVYCYGGSSVIDGDNLDADMAFIAAARSLIPELIAELEQWRGMAEGAFGVTTPDDAGYQIALSGLSIELHGGFGEWGCETLECLFAELGIQPGDGFQEAVEHARADAAKDIAARLQAFGTDCVTSGDMTPAGKRALDKIAEEYE